MLMPVNRILLLNCKMLIQGLKEQVVSLVETNIWLQDELNILQNFVSQLSEEAVPLQSDNVQLFNKY
jgi:hypothetical protein